MICFFADDHFGTHPGAVILQHLPEELKSRITFTENSWELLESGSWVRDCELLVLNMIGSTCGQPHCGPGAEKAMQEYLATGKNVLLLHGSSAAFWQWDWWRKIVGLRWVRPNDPDGVARSVHPKKPFRVVRSKTRHPLVPELQEMELPEDEIYIQLEQVTPVTCLLETQIEEGTFPQAYECATPAGGKMLCLLPGHKAEVTSRADYNANICTMIRYLLK